MTYSGFCAALTGLKSAKDVEKNRGKGNIRGDCSSASVPSQHELFLDPQKQRSRIAFHPLCSYVVSPSNVALGDSRHVFAPMFRSNYRRKKKVSVFICPPHPCCICTCCLTACKEFLFPHPVLPQGVEKMCSVLPHSPRDHH